MLNVNPAVHAAVAASYVAQGGSVELKSGLGKKDPIIKSLDPGTPLTVLKKIPKIGYAQVKLADGVSGWVPLRVITAEAPPPGVKPETVAEAPVRTPQQLQAELEHLQTELQAVRQASANVLRIQAERDLLEENVISLRKELETALREKSVLNDDQKQAWFLIGGGVLFAGILLGVLLPRLSVKRQNGWSSL